jgi:hypothetical protein
LALTKMPLDKFGYYSLVEPFTRILPSGWKSKAQVLLEIGQIGQS